MFNKLHAIWERMVERFRFDSAIMATLEEQHKRIYALEEDVKRMTATVRDHSSTLTRHGAELRGKMKIDVQA